MGMVEVEMLRDMPGEMEFHKFMMAVIGKKFYVSPRVYKAKD